MDIVESQPRRHVRVGLIPIALVMWASLLVVPAPAHGQDRRPEAEQDRVILRDGDALDGQVVFEDAKQVVLRKRTRETSIPRDTIELVDSRVASLHKILDSLADRGPLLRQHADALLEQAAFAEHSRLPGEARLLRLAVLLAEPDHVQANELLGNSLRSKRWNTRRDKGWVRNDELALAPESWKDRWILDTAHYQLRSNLALPDALLVAIDLERLYRAVFELLGPVVELREPREVMVVQLHADDASYPEPGSGRAGHFETGDRIAYASATGGRWRSSLFHEVVRQLLWYTTQQAVNAVGQLPLWLDTGLAEAFSRSTAGPPGAMRFAPEVPIRFSHELQAHAGEPFELSRVLTFSDIELQAPDRHQSLRYAQCTTLVQFLLVGDAGAYRAGLDTFLRSCWQGQSAPGHLETSLGLDLDDFSVAWSAAVARIGGP